MFIIVGFAEHAVILESTPYDETMFGGTVQIAMVGKDQPALIAGPAAQVAAFGESWAKHPKDQPANLGKMLIDHAVCFINRPADSITPVAYFRDITQPDQYSAVTSDPTQSYTYCHPGDDKTHLITELKRAVQDFNSRPEEQYPDVCGNIAEFVHNLVTLPPDARLTYVNFRTGGLLGIGLTPNPSSVN